jgi:hypothetical protein
MLYLGKHGALFSGNVNLKSKTCSSYLLFVVILNNLYVLFGKNNFSQVFCSKEGCSYQNCVFVRKSFHLGLHSAVFSNNVNTVFQEHKNVNMEHLLKNTRKHE